MANKKNTPLKKPAAKKPAVTAKPVKPANKAMDRARQQAYVYYTENRLDQKDIAAILHVSEKTIGRWKAEDKWEDDLELTQLGPERIMKRIIKQYNGLLNQIEERPAPKNIANSKEADILNKLADSVKKLQTEIMLGHKTTVGKQFVSFLMRVYGKDKAIEVMAMWHEFLMSEQ